MTPSVSISAHDLGKRYRIGQRTEPYKSLRLSFSRGLTQSLAHLWRPSRVAANDAAKSQESIWALKEVSFEVRQGEVVGIIGRNGVGKTTLLKVLSRITEPTEGSARVYGRVGSLLEVGTGFHPELTGRENIFLSGSILGMRKREIERKFEEIVEFAEVRKFIDTPVKHYSSGMYTRLAFSVTAHLETEILFVDEVLAVGDVAFQKKCLGKMGEVASVGRTVLFVSHNMSAVRHLCSRAILFHGGRVVIDGDAELVVDRYLRGIDADDSISSRIVSRDHAFAVTKVSLRNGRGKAQQAFCPGDDVCIEIFYEADRPVQRPSITIGIENHQGKLFTASMVLDGARPQVLEGSGVLCCTFKRLPLLPCQLYSICLSIRDGNCLSHVIMPTIVAHFSVDGTARELGFTAETAERYVGDASPVIVPYEWELPNGEKIRMDPLSSRQ